MAAARKMSVDATVADSIFALKEERNNSTETATAFPFTPEFPPFVPIGSLKLAVTNPIG